MHCLVCHTELIPLQGPSSPSRGEDSRTSGLATSSPQSAHNEDGSRWDNSKESGSSTKNLYELIAASSVSRQAPVCQECARQLVEDLGRELSTLQADCTQYAKLHETLRNRYQHHSPADTERKLAQLKQEEAELTSTLGRLQSEQRDLTEQLSSAKKTMQEATDKEKEYWRHFRDSHRRLLVVQEESDSLDAELEYARLQLQRLQNINPIQHAFYIFTNGRIGTINGLRLGRMPNQPVEWDELNAAWGNVAHLLSTLCRIADYDPQRDGFQLMPMASFSSVRRRKDNGNWEEFPLWATGGWRPFGQHNIDSAVSVLVEVFCGLVEHVKAWDQQTDGESRFAEHWLPYTMQRDKIFEMRVEDGIRRHVPYSLRMQFNSEEMWTRAARALLANLKWMQTAVLILHRISPRHPAPELDELPKTTVVS